MLYPFLIDLQMDHQIAGPMDDDGMNDLCHGMRHKSKNINPQFIVFV